MSRLLPVYVCHKQVSAAKITRIITAGRLDGKGPGQTLHFDVTDPISKDDTWMSKHEPEVGGYYVVYKGGYASFSPAAAFEEGYKLKEGYVANER